MLNLSQIQTQVKSTSAPRLNPAHPLAVNDAYRQLKALGWTCVNSEIHPVDRVPVFRLGSAAARRDKDNPGGWIVTVSELEHRFTGEVSEISRFVSELVERCNEPVSEIADETALIETFVSETAPQIANDVSELDGPRNWGESIAELLGQDYRAMRENGTKPRVPTTEEGERMLAAALGASWEQRHADRRAQFGRGR